MIKLKAILWVIGAALSGVFAFVLAGASSMLRKSSAKEASEKLAIEVDQGQKAEELRQKIAELKAEKAVLKAEEAKSHDTVDVANDLIADLSADAKSGSGS